MVLCSWFADRTEQTLLEWVSHAKDTSPNEHWHMAQAVIKNGKDIAASRRAEVAG